MLSASHLLPQKAQKLPIKRDFQESRCATKRRNRSASCCHPRCCLLINADRHSPAPQNGAAQLQRILQNRKSPTRTGSSYAPSSHDTVQMKKQCFSWTAMRTVPRRRQLRLGAEAGASQHTTRFLLVGCVHSALHHGGEAIAPCPAPTHLHGLEVRHRDSCTASLGPRAAKKDTSVHLAANPAPLRRIIGFRAPHSTNASHFPVILRTCVAQSDWRPCRRPCMKSGDIDPTSERCCY
ncbi:hypothetical protein TcCL_Unassigned00005 [Trypanosoma cruzi]|nr:hypothetical protein TcCL_Unassigned00005 [Trypanosoma cruzi]